MPPALCCVPFLGTLASCFDWLVFEFWVLLVFVVRDSPAGTGPLLGPRVSEGRAGMPVSAACAVRVGLSRDGMASDGRVIVEAVFRHSG